MKKLNASGAIGLLISMLIIAILFIIMMPALKGGSSAGLSGSSINQKSVEEQVNKQLEDIEKMRQQTIQYSQEAQNY
ncbi:hypothetical protein IAC76_01915 [Spirochaetes bacterium]|uniref:Uncharacterized protein n=1 Tax=Candidatus Scatousia excrementipullorum TaxID=2840936 RepID=A0A9D9DN40_9BACT|nr:hypothetical protein [Candidatus Scatousia excrementipullorum]